jgi:hypothetical protein
VPQPDPDDETTRRRAVRLKPNEKAFLRDGMVLRMGQTAATIEFA